jgi:Ca-activated chloride channel family protein
MPRTRIASFFILAATAVLVCQDFKSGTNIVTIPVSVSNRVGTERIRDLSADQFRVFEDGVEQDVTAFSSDRRPISLVVALDSSTSMEMSKTLAISAVSRVITGLEPDDEVALVMFADHAEVRIPWTRVSVFPKIDWESWSLGSGTALFDGVRQALDLMAGAHNPRTAILLVSDGGENASKLTFEHVVRTRRQSETMVYAFTMKDTIGLSSKPLPQVYAVPPKPFGAPPELPLGPSEVIGGLVEDSGGRSYSVYSPGDAQQSPDSLLDELRYQYLLGYSPRKPPDGKYRKLKVRMRDERLEVHHRAGYLAMPDAAARRH